MAKSLSSEQIEERRKNLAFIRENAPLIDDDHLFTTTLVMQEEWLATVDELQTYVRDARIIRGLRTRKCLGPTGGLALACEDCYEDIKDYCAPCYLRAIHLTPEMREGIREGVQAVNEGRIRPWSEVEAELDELPSVEEYHGGIPKVQEWTGDGEPTRYKSLLPLDKFAELAGYCPTCGASPTTFVDGDCPKCNPVSCETTGQAHIWVKMGKVNEAAIMEWGDTKCLRCGIPVTVFDFDVQEEEPTHAHLHSHPGVWLHDHPHQVGHHSLNFFGGMHHGPR